MKSTVHLRSDIEPLVKKFPREGGLEFLRIILMFMIVTHHVIVHGLQLKLMSTGSYLISHQLNSIILFLNCFFVVAVNVFVLISGYFSIKFKSTSLVSLILQSLFSTALIYGILDIYHLQARISFNMWNYWFLVAYFTLTLTAQYANRLCDHLSTKDFTRFTFVILFLLSIYGFYYKFSWLGISGGASFIQVLSMYFIGRYLARIKNITANIPTVAFMLGYIFTCLINYSLVYTCIKLGKEKVAWNFFAYNNPLVILGAVFLFTLFTRIKSRFNHRTLSTCMFTVYLLHDNVYVRQLFIENWIGPWIITGHAIPIYTLITSAFIFFVCTIVALPITIFIVKLINLPFIHNIGSRIDRFICLDKQTTNA